MPKTVKKGGTLRFFNIHSVAKFQTEGGRLESFEKLSKKKQNKPGPAQVGAISKAQK